MCDGCVRPGLLMEHGSPDTSFALSPEVRASPAPPVSIGKPSRPLGARTRAEGDQGPQSPRLLASWDKVLVSGALTHAQRRRSRPDAASAPCAASGKWGSLADLESCREKPGRGPETEVGTGCSPEGSNAGKASGSPGDRSPILGGRGSSLKPLLVRLGALDI